MGESLTDMLMASAASFIKDNWGVTAFTKDNELTMLNSAPRVAWSFPVKELEAWLTTLEEIMPEHTAHRRFLEDLYFSLKAAHVKHKEQHEEIVTEAPSADDLMDYLVAYSAAIGEQLGRS